MDHVHTLTAAQSPVAPGCLVEAIRVGERLLLPQKQRQAVLDGGSQHARIAEPREVKIAREVLRELLDATWSPRQSGTRSSSIRSRVPASDGTSSSSFRSFLLARTARLSWPESRYACHSTGACGVAAPAPAATGRFPAAGQSPRRPPTSLRLGLLHLMRVEVQRLLLGEDRLPGQIPAHRLVQVLQPGLVSGEEDERVW